MSLCACVASCASASRSGAEDDGGRAALDAHVVDLGGADLTLVAPAPDMTISCLVPLMGEFCPPVIYVSTTGSDFNSGEMPAFPVRTIPTAIAKALKCQGAPCPIVVAGGTYDGQVVLRDGLTILGGYTQDFLMRDPVAHVVTVTSSDPRTVVADGLVQPTLVDGVTIDGAALTTQDGASSYAVWAHGTRQSLKIAHSTIRAGKGADGAPGAAGVDIVCNTTGASGGTAFDCSASTGAFGTAAGDPVVGGGGGTGGNSNCPNACPLVGTDGISNGLPGSPGGAGANGMGGAPAGSALGSCMNGMWSGSAGTAGTRGENSTGGGGGGAGGTKRIRSCFSCNTLIGGRGGDGAAGGCGGGSGNPGGPGGGAFGVLLFDADVLFDTVVVAGGIGGSGGKGGDGRDGQAGGMVVTNGIQNGMTAKCGLLNYSSGNGAPGGVGGKGGAGGGGAGGAGGVAITVARAANSTLSTMNVSPLTAGMAGMGGAGGKGAGMAGGSGVTGLVAVDQKF